MKIYRPTEKEIRVHKRGGRDECTEIDGKTYAVTDIIPTLRHVRR